MFPSEMVCSKAKRDKIAEMSSPFKSVPITPFTRSIVVFTTVSSAAFATASDVPLTIVPPPSSAINFAAKSAAS